MSVINAVKEGADLTHPKATPGWLIGAVVAGVLLMAVLGIASYLYRKAVSAAGTTTGAALGSGSKVASAIFAYGDGT